MLPASVLPGHSVWYTVRGYAFHWLWTDGSASGLSVYNSELSPGSLQITREEKGKKREKTLHRLSAPGSAFLAHTCLRPGEASWSPSCQREKDAA